MGMEDETNPRKPKILTHTDQTIVPLSNTSKNVHYLLEPATSVRLEVRES